MPSWHTKRWLLYQPPNHARLQAMFFVALSLHAILILGVMFTTATPAILHTTPKLDVTFVTVNESQRPQHADFYAAKDQLGGGSNDLLQPQQAVVQNPALAVMMPQAAPVTERRELSLDERAKLALVLEQEVARIDEVRQRLVMVAQAKVQQQRTRQVSAATHQARDAEYLQQWRQRVEDIGNRHYPDLAKQNKLYGELQLLVAVQRDGSLQRVEIRQSSGHRLLDQAAVRIVKLAAPFAPLPPSISSDTDVLEIIRTWQFLPGEHVVASASNILR